MSKRICICDYCIQEIKSRGEKVISWKLVGTGTCSWCDEIDDLYEVEWR